MKRSWKIYKFSPKGDELICETSVIEKAEKILREAAGKGCSFIVPTELPVEVPERLVTEIEEALKFDVIQIIFPMAGGLLG